MKLIDIKGFEEQYQISDTGKVFSKTRYKKAKGNSKQKILRKILKHQLTKKYLTVALCKNSKIKRIAIHRLVYENFVGEIPKGMQVNHINGNKKDNRVTNLEILTPLENTRHAWKNGLIRKRLGESCSNTKLTAEKIIKIRNLSKRGLTNKKISQIFSVDPSNIHRILKGKTWAHVE